MTRVALAATATAFAAFGPLPALASGSGLKVGTNDVKGISAFGATLNAEVDHAVDGGQVTWQYGKTSAYGATTLPVTLTAQDARQKPSLPLSCLTPGTTYHVRAVATDGITTAYGGDKSFKTPGANGASAPAECSTDPAAGSSDGTSGTSGGTGTGSGTTTTTTGSTSTPATTTTTTAAPAPLPSAPGTTPSGYLGGTDGSGATTAPGVATEDVTPVLGRTVAAAAVTGQVKATAPSGAAVDLTGAKAIPTGTVIDTRAGAVELKTALDGDRVQVARFWGGKFEVRQSPTDKGLTRLVLRGGDFSACSATGASTASAQAAATKKKPRPRSLWGSDSHGRFETRGRGSVATVRGTRWLTQDTCAGTRTRVASGAVAVRDLRRQRTIVVRKGHEYLARVAR
jgi:hypothetical protein